MRLPNVELAIVDETKVTHYLLDSTHADGAAKARFFLKMGFKVDSWQELAVALVDHATKCDIAYSMESSHGTKYIIEGQLTSPIGVSGWIRTVWIIEKETSSPRLVTAYPFSCG